MKKRSDNTIKYLIIGVILVSMLFYLSQSNFLGFVIKESKVYATNFNDVKLIKTANPSGITKKDNWYVSNNYVSLFKIGTDNYALRMIPTLDVSAAILVNAKANADYEVSIKTKNLNPNNFMDIEFLDKGFKVLSESVLKIAVGNFKDNIKKVKSPKNTAYLRAILDTKKTSGINGQIPIDWDNFRINVLVDIKPSCSDTDPKNDIFTFGKATGIDAKGNQFREL